MRIVSLDVNALHVIGRLSLAAGPHDSANISIVKYLSPVQRQPRLFCVVFVLKLDVSKASKFVSVIISGQIHVNHLSKLLEDFTQIFRQSFGNIIPTTMQGPCLVPAITPATTTATTSTADAAIAKTARRRSTTIRHALREQLKSWQQMSSRARYWCQSACKLTWKTREQSTKGLSHERFLDDGQRETPSACIAVFADRVTPKLYHHE